jgi:transposase
MISFTGSLKVFLAVEPMDMRAGFERLHGAVTEKLKGDVRSGALFVFANKRHTLIKILYWDKTGLWLMTKRLERGTFARPKTLADGAASISLAPEALAMLTDGIDMQQATMRPWYQRDKNS